MNGNTKISQKIKDVAKDYQQKFKEDPIYQIGYSIPLLIVMVTFLNGIIAYIRFIKGGGYTTQIAAIKESGPFNEIETLFTNGTAWGITKGVVGYLLLFLFAVELVMMFICYFRDGKKWKRNVMIGMMIILAIQACLIPMGFGTALEYGLTEGVKTAYLYLDTVPWIVIDSKIVFILYFSVASIMLLLFLTLLFTNDGSRQMLLRSLVAAVIGYLVIPLLFWIIQNIIPLIGSALKIVLMVGFFIIICYVLIHGIFESGAESKSSSPRSSGQKEKKAMKEEKKETTEKKQERKENCAYISDYNSFLGIKLYKRKSDFGDYIELDNGVVTRKICTIKALETGKFHIYDEKSGREIKSGEIPWRRNG